MERIIPHEGYARTITSKIKKDDIALIELKGVAKFSLNVSPVCLWSGSDDETYIAGKTGEVKIIELVFCDDNLLAPG